MAQLLMRRESLEGLPEIPEVPAGYVLRTRLENDLEALAAVMQKAFPDMDWSVEKTREALVDDWGVKETFVIAQGDTIVATASALFQEKYPGVGTVHWVAGDPAHSGKRLGYIVTLAVLHAFVRLGCKASNLSTDDFRLPAIKTYLSLGFEPEMTDETHPDRWARVQAQLQ